MLQRVKLKLLTLRKIFPFLAKQSNRPTTAYTVEFLTINAFEWVPMVGNPTPLSLVKKGCIRPRYKPQKYKVWVTRARFYNDK